MGQLIIRDSARFVLHWAHLLGHRGMAMSEEWLGLIFRGSGITVHVGLAELETIEKVHRLRVGIEEHAHGPWHLHPLVSMAATEMWHGCSNRDVHFNAKEQWRPNYLQPVCIMRIDVGYNDNSVVIIVSNGEDGTAVQNEPWNRSARIWHCTRLRDVGERHHGAMALLAQDTAMVEALERTPKHFEQDHELARMLRQAGKKPARI
jgi:hypothetical protein